MKMAVVGKSVWYKMKKTLRGVPFLENNQLQADSSNSALSTRQCRWWFSYNGTPQSVLSFIYWMQVMKVLRLALCSHMGQHIKVKGERWKQSDLLYLMVWKPPVGGTACWSGPVGTGTCQCWTWPWHHWFFQVRVSLVMEAKRVEFPEEQNTMVEREKKKTEGGNIIYETKKKKKSSNKILTVNYIIIKIVLHLIM